MVITFHGSGKCVFKGKKAKNGRICWQTLLNPVPTHSSGSGKAALAQTKFTKGSFVDKVHKLETGDHLESFNQVLSMSFEKHCLDTAASHQRPNNGTTKKSCVLLADLLNQFGSSPSGGLHPLVGRSQQTHRLKLSQTWGRLHLAAWAWIKVPVTKASLWQ